jgi:hypothetical protein
MFIVVTVPMLAPFSAVRPVPVTSHTVLWIDFKLTAAPLSASLFKELYTFAITCLVCECRLIPWPNFLLIVYDISANIYSKLNNKDLYYNTQVHKETDVFKQMIETP